MSTGAGIAAVVALLREAGTPEAAEARLLLAAHLSGLGYDVETQRFAFAPSSLTAFPLFGAGLGWLAVVAIPLLLIPAAPAWAALTLWLAGLIALAAVARGIGLGAVGAGGMREDANLIARRPGATVTRWIVAHTDTKAQGHSIAGRILAVWVTLATIAGFSALAVARVRGTPSAGLVAAAAGAALAAGILSGRGKLRGRTTGARDNGSGLVAALAAAEATQDPAMGILLTGAEEFGLVGARIFAKTRPELVRGAVVFNIDTVDDRGTLSIVSHDGPGRRLAATLAPALRTIGAPLRERRLPLGVFVDSYPLARAGARAVTVARLDWTTLRLLHTPRDSIDGLTFETARAVGRVLARAN